MGRMIGPKTWDRIVEFFGDFMGCPSQSRILVGVVCVNLCIKWLLGMYWAGNGRGLQVHKVNR